METRTQKNPEKKRNMEDLSKGLDKDFLRRSSREEEKEESVASVASRML